MDVKKFFTAIKDEEWRLNGHASDDAYYIANIYDWIHDYVLSGTLLDLGCGTGLFLRYLENKGSNDICARGIEINEQAISFAQEHYPKMAAKISRKDLFSLESTDIKEVDTLLISVGNTEDAFISQLVFFLENIHQDIKSKVHIIIVCYDRIDANTRNKISNIGDKYTIKLINNKLFLLKKKG